MGNGVMATGPKLPRPSLTLPTRPSFAVQRFRQLPAAEADASAGRPVDRALHQDKVRASLSPAGRYPPEPDANSRGAGIAMAAVGDQISSGAAQGSYPLCRTNTWYTTASQAL